MKLKIGGTIRKTLSFQRTKGSDQSRGNSMKGSDHSQGKSSNNETEKAIIPTKQDEAPSKPPAEAIVKPVAENSSLYEVTSAPQEKPVVAAAPVPAPAANANTQSAAVGPQPVDNSTVAPQQNIDIPSNQLQGPQPRATSVRPAGPPPLVMPSQVAALSASKPKLPSNARRGAPRKLPTNARRGAPKPRKAAPVPARTPPPLVTPAPVPAPVPVPTPATVASTIGVPMVYPAPAPTPQPIPTQAPAPTGPPPLVTPAPVPVPAPVALAQAPVPVPLPAPRPVPASAPVSLAQPKPAPALNGPPPLVTPAPVPVPAPPPTSLVTPKTASTRGAIGPIPLVTLAPAPVPVSAPVLIGPQPLVIPAPAPVLAPVAMVKPAPTPLPTAPPPLVTPATAPVPAPAPVIAPVLIGPPPLVAPAPAPAPVLAPVAMAKLAPTPAPTGPPPLVTPAPAQIAAAASKGPRPLVTPASAPDLTPVTLAQPKPASSPAPRKPPPLVTPAPTPNSAPAPMGPPPLITPASGAMVKPASTPAPTGPPPLVTLTPGPVLLPVAAPALRGPPPLVTPAPVLAAPASKSPPPLVTASPVPTPATMARPAPAQAPTGPPPLVRPAAAPIAAPAEKGQPPFVTPAYVRVTPTPAPVQKSVPTPAPSTVPTPARPMREPQPLVAPAQVPAPTPASKPMSMPKPEAAQPPLIPPATLEELAAPTGPTPGPAPVPTIKALPAPPSPRASPPPLISPQILAQLAPLVAAARATTPTPPTTGGRPSNELAKPDGAEVCDKVEMVEEQATTPDDDGANRERVSTADGKETSHKVEKQEKTVVKDGALENEVLTADVSIVGNELKKVDGQGNRLGNDEEQVPPEAVAAARPAITPAVEEPTAVSDEKLARKRQTEWDVEDSGTITSSVMAVNGSLGVPSLDETDNGNEKKPREADKTISADAVQAAQLKSASQTIRINSNISDGQSNDDGENNKNVDAVQDKIIPGASAVDGSHDKNVSTPLHDDPAAKSGEKKREGSPMKEVGAAKPASGGKTGESANISKDSSEWLVSLNMQAPVSDGIDVNAFKSDRREQGQQDKNDIDPAHKEKHDAMDKEDSDPTANTFNGNGRFGESKQRGTDAGPATNQLNKQQFKAVDEEADKVEYAGTAEQADNGENEAGDKVGGSKEADSAHKVEYQTTENHGEQPEVVVEAGQTSQDKSLPFIKQELELLQQEQRKLDAPLEATQSANATVEEKGPEARVELAENLKEGISEMEHINGKAGFDKGPEEPMLDSGHTQTREVVKGTQRAESKDVQALWLTSEPGVTPSSEQTDDDALQFAINVSATAGYSNDSPSGDESSIDSGWESDGGSTRATCGGASWCTWSSQSQDNSVRREFEKQKADEEKRSEEIAHAKALLAPLKVQVEGEFMARLQEIAMAKEEARLKQEEIEDGKLSAEQARLKQEEIEDAKLRGEQEEAARIQTRGHPASLPDKAPSMVETSDSDSAAGSSVSGDDSITVDFGRESDGVSSRATCGGASWCSWLTNGNEEEEKQKTAIFKAEEEAISKARALLAPLKLQVETEFMVKLKAITKAKEDMLQAEQAAARLQAQREEDARLELERKVARLKAEKEGGVATRLQAKRDAARLKAEEEEAKQIQATEAADRRLALRLHTKREKARLKAEKEEAAKKEAKRLEEAARIGAGEAARGETEANIEAANGKADEEAAKLKSKEGDAKPEAEQARLLANLSTEEEQELECPQEKPADVRDGASGPDIPILLEEKSFQSTDVSELKEEIELKGVASSIGKAASTNSVAKQSEVDHTSESKGSRAEGNGAPLLKSLPLLKSMRRSTSENSLFNLDQTIDDLKQMVEDLQQQLLKANEINEVRDKREQALESQVETLTVEIKTIKSGQAEGILPPKLAKVSTGPQKEVVSAASDPSQEDATGFEEDLEMPKESKMVKAQTVAPPKPQGAEEAPPGAQRPRSLLIREPSRTSLVPPASQKVRASSSQPEELQQWLSSWSLDVQSTHDDTNTKQAEESKNKAQYVGNRQEASGSEADSGLDKEDSTQEVSTYDEEIVFEAEEGTPEVQKEDAPSHVTVDTEKAGNVSREESDDEVLIEEDKGSATGAEDTAPVLAELTNEGHDSMVDEEKLEDALTDIAQSSREEQGALEASKEALEEEIVEEETGASDPPLASPAADPSDTEEHDVNEDDNEEQETWDDEIVEEEIMEPDPLPTVLEDHSEEQTQEKLGDSRASIYEIIEDDSDGEVIEEHSEQQEAIEDQEMESEAVDSAERSPIALSDDEEDHFMDKAVLDDHQTQEKFGDSRASIYEIIEEDSDGEMILEETVHSGARFGASRASIYSEEEFMEDADSEVEFMEDADNEVSLEEDARMVSGGPTQATDGQPAQPSTAASIASSFEESVVTEDDEKMTMEETVAKTQKQDSIYEKEIVEDTQMAEAQKRESLYEYEVEDLGIKDDANEDKPSRAQKRGSVYEEEIIEEEEEIIEEMVEAQKRESMYEYEAEEIGREEDIIEEEYEEAKVGTTKKRQSIYEEEILEEEIPEEKPSTLREVGPQKRPSFRKRRSWQKPREAEDEVPSWQQKLLEEKAKKEAELVALRAKDAAKKNASPGKPSLKGTRGLSARYLQNAAATSQRKLAVGEAEEQTGEETQNKVPAWKKKLNDKRGPSTTSTEVPDTQKATQRPPLERKLSPRTDEEKPTVAEPSQRPPLDRPLSPRADEEQTVKDPISPRPPLGRALSPRTVEEKQPAAQTEAEVPAWKKKRPSYLKKTQQQEDSLFSSPIKSEPTVPAWKKKLKERKHLSTPASPKPAPKPAEANDNMPQWKRKLLEQRAKRDAELAALRK